MQLKEDVVDYDEAYLISTEMFKKFDEEMRCGICLNVYREPIELPCYHVYCLDCLRRQVTVQKRPDQFPRCAECNREFNMRTLVANK